MRAKDMIFSSKQGSTQLNHHLHHLINANPSISSFSESKVQVKKDKEELLNNLSVLSNNMFNSIFADAHTKKYSLVSPLRYYPDWLVSESSKFLNLSDCWRKSLRWTKSNSTSLNLPNKRKPKRILKLLHIRKFKSRPSPDSFFSGVNKSQDNFFMDLQSNFSLVNRLSTFFWMEIIGL